KKVGFKPSKWTPVDLGPAGVVHAFRRARNLLQHLVRKHRLLRGVREVCRYHQRKAALAGPLAELDAAGLGQVLESLVRRHLVLRETAGSYSIHPAVRDHFHRVALSRDGGGRHDLLRHQMISLVRRPGQRLPEDAAGLDLVEEAIYHALQAGRRGEAWELYERGLGGLRHLGWRLGGMARGLRVLRGVAPCPD